MFILEERCVPKCSCVAIATEFCQAASQEPGATEKKKKKKKDCKLQGIFMKVESSFQIFLCLKVLRLQRAYGHIICPFYDGNAGK